MREKRYHRARMAGGLLSTALTLGYLWVTGLGSDFNVRLWGKAQTLAGGELSAAAVFLVLCSGFLWVLILPLNYLFDYRLERAFQLSSQRFHAWFLDQLKSAGVGAVLGLPVGLALVWLLGSRPGTWWIWAAGGMFSFSVLLSAVAPVLLFPLFYTFTPVEEASLARLIGETARRAGVRISGSFVFNLSRETHKANAALVGLGSTRRVIFSDTLLRLLDPGEAAAVFAHEAGHHRLRHLAKGLLAGGLQTAFLFYAAGRFLPFTVSFAPDRFPPGDPALRLPLILFVAVILGLILRPLQNALSRRFEYEADRFAAGVMGSAGAMVSSLRKLAALNLADPQPHPLVEWYAYGHPSISRRLAALQGSTTK